jgi:hypothetical protein
MSIFSLAPILATTLNRRSSAATSSPPCPTSFSLLDSLISPAPIVHLYVISMASSLTHSSHISLAPRGSGNCLPLLLGISLSSSGSGVCLSLLLGDMVVIFLFSLLQKKKKFF